MERARVAIWAEVSLKQNFFDAKVGEATIQGQSQHGKSPKWLWRCGELTESAGMMSNDEIQALLLLSSLSNIWETLVVSHRNAVLNGELALVMVKESLLNEKTRRREHYHSGQNKANVAKKHYYGRSKTKILDDRDRSRGRSKSRKGITCWYCDKASHKKSECRKWKHEQRHGKQS